MNHDFGNILPGSVRCFFVFYGINFEVYDSSITALAYSPYRYLKVEVMD